MKYKWILLIIFCLAVFARVYRLDVSSHFEFDESRDLVNMHQIWVEKKITLVGPISEDRGHAYSSLTYYMLLPFAVLFNFDPIGPAAGAVFWGLVTAGMLTWVLAKINSKWLIPAAIISAIWVPLVITSRWAWNPNLLMFWFLAGIILEQKPQWGFKLAAGVAFGLMIHHHYLAIVPVGLWILWKRNLFTAAGAGLALLPFLIFDLRHPPGIFIMRMIQYNQGPLSQNPLHLIQQIPGVFTYFFDYVFRLRFLTIIGGSVIVFLGIWDLITKSRARMWLLLWAGSVLPIVFYNNNVQYVLPALPGFIIWVFFARKGKGIILGKLLSALIITGSILTVANTWHEADWEGNLQLDRGGTQIIAEQIKTQKLVNPNLAVLGSPDIFTNGNKFRNLLLVENIKVKPYEEYFSSDNLFVVTKADIKALRLDPAAEMMYFRNGPVKGVWNIPETDWKVVQFNRY